MEKKTLPLYNVNNMQHYKYYFLVMCANQDQGQDYVFRHVCNVCVCLFLRKICH